MTSYDLFHLKTGHEVEVTYQDEETGEKEVLRGVVMKVTTAYVRVEIEDGSYTVRLYKKDASRVRKLY